MVKGKVAKKWEGRKSKSQTKWEKVNEEKANPKKQK